MREKRTGPTKIDPREIMARLAPYGLQERLCSALKEEETLTGQFLLALYRRMPIADLVSVSLDCLLDCCRAARRVWEERGSRLPEDIFLDFLLCHRVNDEKITKNRSALQEILLPMLGEDEKENVKRINYWCASQVRYQSTDERTMDAAGVWRSGFGRCGEESVFFVSALRSCGIPARQVYALWWAHTDDNHAWTEVWIDGKWHYAGACEPEEILDKGWFDDAAARAMMIAGKRFFAAGAEPCKEEFVLVNRTAAYAKTGLFRLRLLYLGKPLPTGSLVELLLPNGGGFRRLSFVRLAEEGWMEIQLGIGDLLLSVCRGDGIALIPVHTEKDREKTFEISEYLKDEGEKWREMLFKAPLPSSGNRKQAPKRKEISYEAKPFPNAEVENYALRQGFEQLWKILGEKDRREITAKILSEAAASPRLQGIPAEIYLPYVANPRAGLEHLTACREIFRKEFQDEEQIRAFAAQITRTQESLLTSPLHLWQSRTGNERSVQIFTVTALRSLGIPAKLENGLVFRYQEGSFLPFSGEKTGRLILEGEAADYQKTWSLARRTEKGYELLDASSVAREMQLPEGDYLAVTSLRTAGGDSSVKMKRFTLSAGEKKLLTLCFRSVPLREEKMRAPLPSEISGLLSESEGWRLVVWAEEGAEPTRHLLDELTASGFFLEEVQIDLLFSEKFSGKDRGVLRLSDEAKRLSLHEELGSERAELFGRSLFVDHENFPIVAFCRGEEALYGFSGYQVGSVVLMERLAAVIKEDEHAL